MDPNNIITKINQLGLHKNNFQESLVEVLQDIQNYITHVFNDLNKKLQDIDNP